MQVRIYGLCDPETHIVRYIGKTKFPLETRLTQHLNRSSLETHTHKNCWIKSLKRRGKTPEIMLLDVGDEGTWEDLERFHINSHRTAGFKLTNQHLGGVGAPRTRTPLMTRKKLSSKALAKVRTPEHCLNISKAKKGKPAWNKGRKASEEEVRKNREGHLGLRLGTKTKPCTQETRDKISRANKGRKKPPTSEEARKNLSRSLKGKPKSPEAIRNSVEAKRRNREKRLNE